MPIVASFALEAATSDGGLVWLLEADQHLASGTVIRRDNDGILIQCGDRPLLLVAAEPVETKTGSVSAVVAS